MNHHYNHLTRLIGQPMTGTPVTSTQIKLGDMAARAIIDALTNPARDTARTYIDQLRALDRAANGPEWCADIYGPDEARARYLADLNTAGLDQYDPEIPAGKLLMMWHREHTYSTTHYGSADPAYWETHSLIMLAGNGPTVWLDRYSNDGDNVTVTCTDGTYQHAQTFTAPNLARYIDDAAETATTN